MYLIVGANGFLGAYFLKNLLAKGQEEIFATARNIETFGCQEKNIHWQPLHVENHTEVDGLARQLQGVMSELKVVYLAAYHHPDMVERHPHRAWHINVTAWAYFLNRFDGVRFLVYPSTDVVYGEGDVKTKFREDSALHPVNRYGKHKMAAECLATSYGHHVVRYPFLIGHSLVQHKKHFYDEILENLALGKEVKMFEDSYRSSLDFDTAARLTLQLIERDQGDTPQVLNVAGDTGLSKYDVGLMIAKKYGGRTDLIVPVSVREKLENFTTPRAATAIMDNSKVKALLGLEAIEIQI